MQERGAEQALRRELRDRGVESAALAGATSLLSMAPTRTQRELYQELEELERQQEAGEPALDPDIRNLMDRAGAAAGRLATQLGQQFESTMAAGGGTSAADIRRVQGEAMSQAASARREVGMDAAQQELLARQEREEKVAQLQAMRFEEEKARRQALAESVALFSQLLGRVRGESTTEIVNLAAASGEMDADEIMDLYRWAQRSETARSRFWEGFTWFGGTAQEREPNMDRGLFRRDYTL